MQIVPQHLRNDSHNPKRIPHRIQETAHKVARPRQTARWAPRSHTAPLKPREQTEDTRPTCHSGPTPCPALTASRTSGTLPQAPLKATGAGLERGKAVGIKYPSAASNLFESHVAYALRAYFGENARNGCRDALREASRWPAGRCARLPVYSSDPGHHQPKTFPPHGVGNNHLLIRREECWAQGAWRGADGLPARTPEAPSPAAAGEGASARENAPCWSATSCSPTD